MIDPHSLPMSDTLDPASFDPVADTAEDIVPAPQPPPVEVSKRYTKWTNDEARLMLRVGKLCQSRNVGIAIGCLTCGERISAVGRDNAGNTVLECACTTMVWEART